ncbi:uncharacterized protein CLUP02_00568 [Colletotrichum lupini]|uniref:Uncharacterized protein n=1 Tax=Colletotrichum lupini TaxID=145971 RepID=A0A9Q8SAL9_9PEZI|nr:uncharacterized protein CLUP02_00568 [Colletotrichum lupini]UQC73921.1 hypothetical protein CLUP02_00568 [Colletotrichum lupini]
MSRDGIMVVLSAEKLSSKLSNPRKLFVSNSLVLVPMPAGRKSKKTLAAAASCKNPSFGGVVRFQPLLSQRKGEWGHGAMDGYGKAAQVAHGYGGFFMTLTFGYIVTPDKELQFLNGTAPLRVFSRPFLSIQYPGVSLVFVS